MRRIATVAQMLNRGNLLTTTPCGDAKVEHHSSGGNAATEQAIREFAAKHPTGNPPGYSDFSGPASTAANQSHTWRSSKYWPAAMGFAAIACVAPKRS